MGFSFTPCFLNKVSIFLFFNYRIQLLFQDVVGAAAVEVESPTGWWVLGR